MEKKIKILVGSRNPVKIASVKEAFMFYFSETEVIGIDVDSLVPAQPFADDTFIGAKNRSETLLKLSRDEKLNADYFIGIEGGVAKQFGKWFAFGCMCIMDETGNTGYGLSPQFQLPDVVVKKLELGFELGDVMDEIQNEENTKQKQGAIGFFTNGVMNRKELYIEGLKVAIVPFLHKKMFFNGD